MQGKIVRGIAGFYYVHEKECGIFECRAKGIFRKNKEKPLVGDNVIFDVTDMEQKTGNITALMERSSELIRPAVANIDQALIIFAAAKPEPNYNLLDRFLLMMRQKGMQCLICFNKADLIDDRKQKEMEAVYKDSGFPVLFVSAKNRQGIETLKECLKGKTTTAAGPSGVGKSSLINVLQSNVTMETGKISEKIERGRHTTRHTELIMAGEGTYLLDTPGFSSLNVFPGEKEAIKSFYREFDSYAAECRFLTCNHINEPDCKVKQAVEQCKINRIRYDNYQQIFAECADRKKY